MAGAFNTVRPHSSLGYRPPAPEVLLSGMPMPPCRPGPTGSPSPPATMLHQHFARTQKWGLVKPGGPKRRLAARGAARQPGPEGETPIYAAKQVR